MADNTTILKAGGVEETIATRQVTYSGDAGVKAPVVGLVTFAGSDDAKTAADVPAGEGAAATAVRVALATDGTVIGAVGETAPATDTASSGLNGRLQRIAQRLTSLLALLPASLGQKTKAASLAVTLASDQELALPAGAATEATLNAVGAAVAVIDDWDETDRAKVNPIVGQAGVEGGAGASTALTQRVAIATDANAVTGNVASGAADSGNPVKMGGRHNTTLPTLADGQRGDVQLGTRGAVSTSLFIANSVNPMAAPTGDGGGASTYLPAAMLVNSVGTSWDRVKGNFEAALLASAARTATTNSPDQTNFNGQGALVTINVSVEGAATVSLKLQGKDSVSGNYYDIVDFGAIYTATSDAPGAKTCSFHPGNVAADHVGIANGTAAKSGLLPRIWRAVVTPSDATSTTYSLSATTE